MPPGMRLGDKAQCPMDSHGCPACPHTTVGPAIQGSSNVYTNGRPAIRQDDPGVHAACCGTNTWIATQGSTSVFINNRPAVRQADETTHCGGKGRVIEGSPNVIIGGGSSSSAAGPGGQQARTSGGGATNGGGSTNSGGTANNANVQSSANNSAAGESGAQASPQSANDRADQSPDSEPEPLLVSARWAKDRAATATRVKLSATCEDLAGKSATFTIRDADDESRTVATVSASCGAQDVNADWTTPSDGPPSRFVFTVAVDGKEASSGVLTLVTKVEVKLTLDEEPASGVRVRLRAEPSGEERSEEADDQGVVRFDEAPLGEYALILDEEGPA